MTANTTSKKILSLVIILLCLCSVSAGCISVASHDSASFIEDSTWSPEVKTALNDFVAAYGNTSGTYDNDSYVVFDFDNTTCINDITFQSMYYQLETMSFAQDPETFSKSLKYGLDEKYYDIVDDIIDAYSTLYEKYGPFSPGGLDEETQKIIKTDPVWLEFASKMGYLGFKDVPNDNWDLSWKSGMTADEIYNIGCNSCKKYGSMNTYAVTISGPSDIQSRVGPKSFSFASGTSVTNAMIELWKVLQENGIDVWVCSASEVNLVRAAVDSFGLHPFCKGVVGNTVVFDANGKFTPEFNYETGLGALAGENGTWEKSAYYTKAECRKEGKVDAILNAISPYYHNKTPLAGFMDSSGDFNFCTEFKNLKLVVCFNRADRAITDGGGLVAAVAMYQQNSPKSDLLSVNGAGDTLYLLQGINENGLRDFRPSNCTTVFGDTEEKLFKNEDNYKLLSYLLDKSMSIGDIMNKFSLKTDAESPDNPIGVKYGFLTEYRGYHSISN